VQLNTLTGARAVLLGVLFASILAPLTWVTCGGYAGPQPACSETIEYFLHGLMPLSFFVATGLGKILGENYWALAALFGANFLVLYTVTLTILRICRGNTALAAAVIGLFMWLSFAMVHGRIHRITDFAGLMLAVVVASGPVFLHSFLNRR
jgi:hypothetical protein